MTWPSSGKYLSRSADNYQVVVHQLVKVTEVVWSSCKTHYSKCLTVLKGLMTASLLAIRSAVSSRDSGRS